ncbi:hypothetical protein U1Q18_039225 [Sarracenia purpurea var. burkii]
MSVPGISAILFNRIADFLSEVWSIRIARSRAIRRRRESLKLKLHNRSVHPIRSGSHPRRRGRPDITPPRRDRWINGIESILLGRKCLGSPPST